MRVSKMVRWTGLAGVIALVGACSDAPTAAPTAVATPGEVAFAKGGNGKNTVNTKVFTVVPGQPLVVALGNYTLYMSANALCAQNEGYGREFWNQSCELEKSPVNITASWSAADGEGNIAFNRDVRFSPSSRVYLLLKATGKYRNSDAILWREGTGSKVFSRSARRSSSASPTASTTRPGIRRRIRRLSPATTPKILRTRSAARRRRFASSACRFRTPDR